jgi:hypothetical protein
MTQDATPAQSSLLKVRVKVPQHVVHRSFPSETVVLNLQTGKYYGLNPTAGSMLDALENADSVQDAATTVAREYEQPPEAIEQDMCDLCSVLLERGLIEIEGDGAG